MSKPAPGPWRLSATDDTLVRSADNGLVAVAHGDYGCDWEVMEANARLIASAPDLLEALQTCMAALHWNEEAGCLTGITGDQWHAALDIIAKATGEAA